MEEVVAEGVSEERKQLAEYFRTLRALVFKRALISGCTLRVAGVPHQRPSCHCAQ